MRSRSLSIESHAEMQEMIRKILIGTLAKCGNRFCGVGRHRKRKDKKEDISHISQIVIKTIIGRSLNLKAITNRMAHSHHYLHKPINCHHSNQTFHLTVKIAYLSINSHIPNFMIRSMRRMATLMIEVLQISREA